MSHPHQSQHRAGGIHDDVAQNIRTEQRGSVDRNPSLPCDRCGESFNWQDYWQERITDNGNRVQPFWCDSCWGELIEQAKQDRHAEEHKQLTEWSG